MPSPDSIRAGHVVTIHYTLRNAHGEDIDTTRDGDPVPYLHGSGNIVPGLEAGLEGHRVGEQLTIAVEPDQGYGDHDPEGVQAVPRDTFPDDVELEVGMRFVTEGPDGELIPVEVKSIEEDTVEIDLNHPLAGQSLSFEVTIVELREATEEEREHGHAHDDGCDDEEE
jgi:FKBP-type peptidyl-prolyl cis-trans isomerase SlyD